MFKIKYTITTPLVVLLATGVLCVGFFFVLPFLSMLAVFGLVWFLFLYQYPAMDGDPRLLAYLEAKGGDRTFVEKYLPRIFADKIWKNRSSTPKVAGMEGADDEVEKDGKEKSVQYAIYRALKELGKADFFEYDKNRLSSRPADRSAVSFSEYEDLGDEVRMRVHTHGKLTFADFETPAFKLKIGEKFGVSPDSVKIEKGVLTVPLKEATWDIVDYDPYDEVHEAERKSLEVVLGFDKRKQPIVIDIAKAPHILLGGQTGGGKSIILENLILGIFRLMFEEKRNIKLYIYGKKQDFESFTGFPNVEIIDLSDVARLVTVISSLSAEVERRDKSGKSPDTRIIIVDEIAFVMLKKDDKKDGGKVMVEQFEAAVQNIGQLGRSYKIHQILATQSPRADIITGKIKANLPTTIGVRTKNLTESQIILGQDTDFKLHEITKFNFVLNDVNRQELIEGRSYVSSYNKKEVDDDGVEMDRLVKKPAVARWLRVIKAEARSDNSEKSSEGELSITATSQDALESMIDDAEVSTPSEAVSAYQAKEDKISTLYHAVVDYENNQGAGKGRFISQKIIQEVLGVSERKAKDMIAELKAQGVIASDPKDKFLSMRNIDKEDSEVMVILKEIVSDNI